MTTENWHLTNDVNDRDAQGGDEHWESVAQQRVRMSTVTDAGFAQPFLRTGPSRCPQKLEN